MDYTLTSTGVKIREGSWQVHSIDQFDSDHQLITCQVEVDAEEPRNAALPYAYKKM